MENVKVLSNRRLERGQALILMVLSFVGLLGLSALAIDGGRIYADRRYAYNRADAASVAGAGAAAGYLKKVQDDPATDSTGTTGPDWDCEAPAVITARGVAEDQAVVNLDQNNIDDPSTYAVQVHCEEGAANYIDVRVILTFNSQTSFMHFVFGGIAQNTVEAVTRVIPRAPAAAGFAIATLDETCTAGEKGIWFAGTGGNLYVNIDDGGIFSNSCINTSGPGETKVTVNGGLGPASYWHGFGYSGGDTVNPVPQPVTYRIDPRIPPPSCVGDIDPPYVEEGGVRKYRPGIYTNTIKVTSVPVILEPGLYCFDNGANFEVTGTELTGNGVTFYFKKDGGSFTTEGNGTVDLSAPQEPCDDDLDGYLFEDCSPAVPGLLIYFDEANENTIKIGGNSFSSYKGTIYARKSLVMIGGTTENLSVSVQVIAHSVKVHGSATIQMSYDDSLIWHSPNMINLEK